MAAAPTRGAGAAGRAALVAFGVAVGIALLEGVARVGYEGPWHERLAEGQIEIQLADYRLNRFRLRDVDYALPPPPGHRRVLLLGDSFTFGLGVLDEAAIFAARIEERLNRDLRPAGATRVDVLNGGLNGSLTAGWLQLFEFLAPRYRPELVVLVFFLRDGTRTGSVPDFFGAVHDEITARNRASRLYRVSFLYRRLRDGLDRRAIGERYTRRFHDSYFGDESQTAEWRSAQRNLLEIRRRARARGGDAALVVFPVLFELGEDHPFEAIGDLVADWGRAHGFPVLDLLESFRGQRAPDLWVAPWDQHPNAAGHAIAAEAIAPFVARLLESREGA